MKELTDRERMIVYMQGAALSNCIIKKLMYGGTIVCSIKQFFGFGYKFKDQYYDAKRLLILWEDLDKITGSESKSCGRRLAEICVKLNGGLDHQPTPGEIRNLIDERNSETDAYAAFTVARTDQIFSETGIRADSDWRTPNLELLEAQARRWLALFAENGFPVGDDWAADIVKYKS